MNQAAADDHLSDFSEDLTASVTQALAALERELGDAGATPVGTPGVVGDLQRLLTEARRLVGADAGTIFLRAGETLRFALVQNDTLSRHMSAEELRRCFQRLPLLLNENSIVGYVAVTGEVLNIADVYRVPPDRPYVFNRTYDERYRYRTCSVLAAPIHDTQGDVAGVIELINALDASGRVIAFDSRHVPVVQRLAARAALILEARRRGEKLAAHGTAEADAPVPPEAPDPATEVAPVVARREPKAWGVPTSFLSPWRLGELLVVKGAIHKDQLTAALAEQKRSNDKLGTILVRLGFITERQLVDALSEQYGIPTLDLSALTPDAEVLKLMPPDFARRYSVFPVQRDGHSVSIALADPTDVSVLDNVRFITGLNVVPLLAPLADVRSAIERSYDGTASAAVLDALQSDVGGIELAVASDEKTVLDLSESPAAADDVPAVRLVNAILSEAIRRGVSDVHLESFAKTLRVRLRVDGRLRHAISPPKRMEAAIVSRIKIMADLDIAQRRLPQDGRFKLAYNGRQIDVRVSIVPTLFGESVNLRILDGAALQPNLAQLGFDPAGLNEFLKALENPHGVVLITGPTGSGKTTTLYSAIHTLSKQDLKILTLEDPVEYALEGVNQVNVQEDIGRSFASTLRSFLRHDPDVILVGEMRDLETAQTAIRAGLTGHLVLSTLHTNDCASTIARLLDMTIPPVLVAAALRLLVAQRLVRRVCPDCRQPYEVDEESLVQHGHTPQGRGACTLYRAIGCAACSFTGMRGRAGVYEVMPITPAITDLILKNGSTTSIREAARHAGMKTLRETGLLRMLDGITTLEEVVRTISA